MRHAKAACRPPAWRRVHPVGERDRPDPPRRRIGTPSSSNRRTHLMNVYPVFPPMAYTVFLSGGSRMYLTVTPDPEGALTESGAGPPRGRGAPPPHPPRPPRPGKNPGKAGGLPPPPPRNRTGTRIRSGGRRTTLPLPSVACSNWGGAGGARGGSAGKTPPVPPRRIRPSARATRQKKY